MVRWKVKVPLPNGRRGNGVLEPRRVFGTACKRGPNPPLLLPLTFLEVNQVLIYCWVDREGFPVFWPELTSNLWPSAPQPSTLTARPMVVCHQNVVLKFDTYTSWCELPSVNKMTYYSQQNEQIFNILELCVLFICTVKFLKIWTPEKWL